MLYKEHQSFIDVNYIRDHLALKLLHKEEALHNLTHHDQAHKEEPIEHTPSPDETLHQIHLLNAVNIVYVLKNRAALSLECLIRLRKYQLIDRMDLNPEGGHLVTLDLSQPQHSKPRINLIQGESSQI